MGLLTLLTLIRVLARSQTYHRETVVMEGDNRIYFTPNMQPPEGWSNLYFDDAFVTYLNRIEIAKEEVSGNPPLASQFANGLHESLLYQGLAPEVYFLFEEKVKALLKEESNVLVI